MLVWYYDSAHINLHSAESKHNQGEVRIRPGLCDAKMLIDSLKSSVQFYVYRETKGLHEFQRFKNSIYIFWGVGGYACLLTKSQTK